MPCASGRARAAAPYSRAIERLKTAPRRALALEALVVARLRSRRGASALIVAAIALATVAVVSAQAAMSLARDAALRDVVRSAGAAAASTAQVSRPAGTSEEVTALWNDMERRFPKAGLTGPPGRGVVLSPQPVGGQEYALAGAADSGRWLRLASGRRPVACRTEPCEVVAVGAAKVPERLTVRGVELRVVGTGRISAVPLGPVPPPQPALAAGATFLVAEGTDLLALPQLERVPRVLHLSGALDPFEVHPWTADDIVAGLERGRAALTGDVEGARATTPASLLAAEQRRGRAASRQAQLIAVLAATILAAFLALAATQRARDVGAELSRLSDAGATVPLLAAFAVLEASTLAVLGGALALLLATVATAAAGASLPVVLLTPGTAVALGCCLLGATAVLAAGALAGAVGRGRTIAEIVAAVVLALIAWLTLTRGPITAGELADASLPDPVLVLLPAALAVVAGGLAYRVLPSVLRTVAKRTSGLSARLALLSALRARGRTATAVACLALSLGSALFALTYRDALRDGQVKAAAFRIGADARVEGLSTGVQPLDLPAGVRQGFALRTTGRTAARDAETALIGVSPGMSPELERLDGAPRIPRFEGATVGAGDRELRLRYSIEGSALAVSLAFQRADGTFERILLGTELRPGPARFTTPVPRSLRGARLFAVEVTLPLGAGAAADEGVLVVQPVELVDGDGPVKRFELAGWQPATDGSVFGRPDGGAAFRFALVTQQRYLAMRAAQPSVREPVPAIVSPDLVAQQAGGGRLPLRINGGDRVNLQIVGVRKSFPTVSAERFAIVDTGRLYAVANAKFPGSAVPRETWLDYPDRLEEAVVASVGRAPGAPRLRTRAQELDELRADPVARGTLGALLAVAALGAAVSLAGLVISLAATIRDESGELAELEALGVGPDVLRRQIRLGAALLAGCGVLCGAALGIVLTRVFTELLAVGADGRSPLPPLTGDLPWATVAEGVALVAVLAAAAIAVRGRGALRGTEVGRLRG